jgi:hypothetical protein
VVWISRVVVWISRVVVWISRVVVWISRVVVWISRVVVWIREFLSGRTQRVRVEGQLSEEVRVTSGVPQGSVLGPLLFLAYVNDTWRNMESTIRHCYRVTTQLQLINIIIIIIILLLGILIFKGLT